MRWIIWLGWMVLALPAWSQLSVSGTVTDGRTGKPLAYATLQGIPSGPHTTTDEQGRFTLQVPSDTVIALRIRAIGLDTTVVLSTSPSKLTLTVWPEIATLRVAEVHGLTARAIVDSMLARMDSNHRAFGYAASGFYRQYNSINNRYTNLVEAQLTTLFRKHPQEPGYVELHAIEALRRSVLDLPFTGYEPDPVNQLFRQNPLFHPATGSLSPSKLRDYTFWMDTLDYPGYYRVYYRCADYSSDNHGVSNFRELNRKGEAREEGTLKIERNSFALLAFERKAHRNPAYTYPFSDNYVLPAKDYQLEFGNSYLRVVWKEKGGQWVVNQMHYQFTNDYRHVLLQTVDYTVSTLYEWYARDHSRFISGDLLARMQEQSHLYKSTLPYDATQWNRPWPPYQFVSKTRLESDIREWAGALYINN